MYLFEFRVCLIKRLKKQNSIKRPGHYFRQCYRVNELIHFFVQRNDTFNTKYRWKDWNIHDSTNLNIPDI